MKFSSSLNDDKFLSLQFFLSLIVYICTITFLPCKNTYDLLLVSDYYISFSQNFMTVAKCFGREGNRTT